MSVAPSCRHRARWRDSTPRSRRHRSARCRRACAPSARRCWRARASWTEARAELAALQRNGRQPHAPRHARGSRSPKGWSATTATSAPARASKRARRLRVAARRRGRPRCTRCRRPGSRTWTIVQRRHAEHGPAPGARRCSSRSADAPCGARRAPPRRSARPTTTPAASTARSPGTSARAATPPPTATTPRFSALMHNMAWLRGSQARRQRRCFGRRERRRAKCARR